MTVRNLSELAYNLPLVHACAVLNDTLLQLRDEGQFSCRKFFLGALLHDSRLSLPWADWTFMSEIVYKRNSLAHRGNLVSANDCLRYIEAIENELTAWNIL